MTIIEKPKALFIYARDVSGDDQPGNWGDTAFIPHDRLVDLVELFPRWLAVLKELDARSITIRDDSWELFNGYDFAHCDELHLSHLNDPQDPEWSLFSATADEIPEVKQDPEWHIGLEGFALEVWDQGFYWSAYERESSLEVETEMLHWEDWIEIVKQLELVTS